MKKHVAKSLISKYTKGETTPEESGMLEQGFLKDLQDSKYTPVHTRIEEADKRISANLMDHIGVYQTKTKITRIWPRIAAAASILFFLSFGAYFLFHKNSSVHLTAKNQIHDVAPGNRKAILILANGKTIILNNSQNGMLAKQGTSAIKTTNGVLVYQQLFQSAKVVQPAVIDYNSIVVPRGAEYQVVVLPDGSRVWINSASSLRYPTTFTGSERKVELTGEAYFEVTHNPAMPFRVVTNTQIVEVLGTHFNINAYNDEQAVKTTLLEGKVKVTAAANSEVRFLLPGQQAALNSSLFTVNRKSGCLEERPVYVPE
jgi:transmembrane sensor